MESNPASVGTPILWGGFTAIVLALLAVDLGLFNRRERELTHRQAILWTLAWISIAGLFALGTFWFFGHQRGLEFVTGYLIEEALSVDNLFVFIVLFRYFKVPPRLQRRVLFWGIIGALVMRAAFIVAGAALLRRFEFLEYALGAFLVFTGGRLLFESEEDEEDPSGNLALRFAKRFLPMTDRLHGARFFVVENGRRLGTPLLLVLFVVELTDVVFALDSIPAIFSITQDPFVVYTSNICAILGLRSLYFLLAGAMLELRYLNVGLAFVLMFVGIKMAGSWLFEIPIVASLAVVAGLLLMAVVASLVADRREAKKKGA